MAAGEKAACAELYDRFSRPLYSIALKVLRDEKEAEDVIQEVFVTMWERAADFIASRGTAFAWAVTLTRNRAIDRVRKRQRRSTLLELGAEDLQPGAQSTPAATDHLAFQEQARALRTAVAALPLEQKAALELAFYSGLTQQEIAERLSEPLGTIKARIRRGLLKLRDAVRRRDD